jgi:ABC-2 type transport system permease protein
MEASSVKKQKQPGKFGKFISSLLPKDSGKAGNKNAGLYVLFRKELADHIRSKKFIVILILVAVTAIASLYSALSGLQQSITDEGSDFVFLKLFTASGGGIPSFIFFIALLGPLIGLTLGFDAINGERSKGTLNRLVAQPIYRDAIINGKFLAGFAVIAITVFSIGFIISGVGLYIIGVPPSLEEIVRLLVFMIFTIFYMGFWLGLSILFSVLFRHAATSALSVIALWLFLAIFLGLLAGVIAGALYPLNDYSTTAQQLSNANATLAINRISPSYLYSEAVSTILSPNVRTLGLVTQSQMEYAVAGSLPLGQSLLLVWPHLTGLFALTMISFAASYICFMRQEVRAG